jgi:hypothetical protein
MMDRSIDTLTAFDGTPCGETVPETLDGACRQRLSIVEIRLDEQRVLYRCEQGHTWDATFVNGKSALLHLAG